MNNTLNYLVDFSKKINYDIYFNEINDYYIYGHNFITKESPESIINVINSIKNVNKNSDNIMLGSYRYYCRCHALIWVVIGTKYLIINSSITKSCPYSPREHKIINILE